MEMSVQQGDLPQEENTMKRLFAGTLALVMTCGLLFSGCGKRMTPEEEAASQEDGNGTRRSKHLRRKASGLGRCQ